MSKLISTDVLLVNRADTTYQMTFADLEASVTSKLQNGLTLSGDPLPVFEDSDKFAVNRNDITYTLTFAELKNSISLAIPPVLTNVSLVENNPGVSPRFTSQAFTASTNLSVDGIPQSEKTIDAHVDGTLLLPIETSEIIGVGDSTGGVEYTDGTVVTGNSGVLYGSWNNIFNNPDNDSSLHVAILGGPKLSSWGSYTLPTPITANSTVTISSETSHPSAAIGGPSCAIACSSGAVPTIPLPGYAQQLTTVNITDAPAVITGITLYTGGEQSGYPVSTLYSIEIDGVPFGEALKILTFADDTNIAKFEVDDEVIDSNGNATGTFKSSSIEYLQYPSMTLRNPTGTWTANNGSYAIGPKKPFDNTRLYCVFDSSGNVSSLLDTPQSPAYVTTDINPGLTLTFPATFPSGLTPDEEIGDGTTLTVEVTAENESGTSGPLSATVQPSSTVTTGIRSLTTEELEAQKLKFATYENRKMVNCGQQAQAARDNLKTALLAAGYTEPEIAAAYVNPDDSVTPAEPVAISGYYPLYETEAEANAAGNGSSHTHIFNSTTYYMPDGGVTIYHGTYGSSSSGY